MHSVSAVRCYIGHSDWLIYESFKWIFLSVRFYTSIRPSLGVIDGSEEIHHLCHCFFWIKVRGQVLHLHFLLQPPLFCVSRCYLQSCVWLNSILQKVLVDTLTNPECVQRCSHAGWLSNHLLDGHCRLL